METGGVPMVSRAFVVVVLRTPIRAIYYVVYSSFNMLMYV